MKELSLRGRTYPGDLNHNGKAFGGFIMSKMDKAASIAVENMMIGNAVTISVSNLEFKKPVNNGDIFSIYTDITYIGNSSIKVYVDFCTTCKETKEENSVTHATFTFVCVDEDGNSAKVRDYARKNLSHDLQAMLLPPEEDSK